MACMVERQPARRAQGCHGSDRNRSAAGRSRDLVGVCYTYREPGGPGRDRTCPGRYPGAALAGYSPGAHPLNGNWAKRYWTPIAVAAIFAANLWLNAPLFMPGDLPFPGSIERGYVGMARFVSEHPNPWGWNPFPYCGLPTQFMYVPALPYFAGLWMRLLPHASPDTVYRIIVGLAACLGPGTLFWLPIHFVPGRRWPFLAAMAYSFLSPSYWLFPAVETDRGIAQLPWRIQVLAKYGE